MSYLSLFRHPSLACKSIHRRIVSTRPNQIKPLRNEIILAKFSQSRQPSHKLCQEKMMSEANALSNIRDMQTDIPKSRE
ncbi:MAG: hypothetical protein O4861_21055 [Trichodesmium sp. St16_bin4-tuft]|nr:hypothetical protein [Trichodesmium sp. St16_bin4-tuft]